MSEQRDAMESLRQAVTLEELFTDEQTPKFLIDKTTELIFVTPVITPDDNRTHSRTSLERNNWKNPFTQSGPFNPAQLIPNADMQEHVDDYLEKEVSTLLDRVQDDLSRVLQVARLLFGREDLHNTRMNNYRRINQRLATVDAATFESLSAEEMRILYLTLARNGGDEGRHTIFTIIKEMSPEWVFKLTIQFPLSAVFVDLRLSKLLDDPESEEDTITIASKLASLRTQSLLATDSLPECSAMLKLLVENTLGMKLLSVVEEEFTTQMDDYIHRSSKSLERLVTAGTVLWQWSPCFKRFEIPLNTILEIMAGDFEVFAIQIKVLRDAKRQELYQLLVRLENKPATLILYKCLDKCPTDPCVVKMFNHNPSALFSDLRIGELLANPDSVRFARAIIVSTMRNLKINLMGQVFQRYGFDKALDLLLLIETDGVDEETLETFVRTLDSGIPEYIFKSRSSSLDLILLRLENWQLKQAVAQMRFSLSSQSKQIAELQHLSAKVGRQSDEIALLSQRQSQQLAQVRALQQKPTPPSNEPDTLTSLLGQSSNVVEGSTNEEPFWTPRPPTTFQGSQHGNPYFPPSNIPSRTSSSGSIGQSVEEAAGFLPKNRSNRSSGFVSPQLSTTSSTHNFSPSRVVKNTAPNSGIEYEKI